MERVIGFIIESNKTFRYVVLKQRREDMHDHVIVITN